MDWTGAACQQAGIDPNIFIPNPLGDEALDAERPSVILAQVWGGIDAAKKICASCPLATKCLEYALQGDLEGVWGGTTEWERRGQVEPRPPSGHTSLHDGRRREDLGCGTDAGFARHERRRKLEPEHRACDACREAHNVRQRERRSVHRESLEAFGLWRAA